MTTTEAVFAAAAARKAAAALAEIPFEVGEVVTVVEPFEGEIPATVVKVTKAAVTVEIATGARFRLHGAKRGETLRLM